MIVNGSGPSFENTNIRLLYKVEDPTIAQPFSNYKISIGNNEYKGFCIVMLNNTDSRIATVRFLYPPFKNQTVWVKVEGVLCCRQVSVISPYINFENGYRHNETTLKYELDNECAIIHSIYGIY